MTEIKFRELYEGSGDELPKEFQILPNPTDIFEEKKAIEKVIQIEDMNISSKNGGVEGAAMLNKNSTVENLRSNGIDLSGLGNTDG